MTRVDVSEFGSLPGWFQLAGISFLLVCVGVVTFYSLRVHVDKRVFDKGVVFKFGCLLFAGFVMLIFGVDKFSSDSHSLVLSKISSEVPFVLTEGLREEFVMFLSSDARVLEFDAEVNGVLEVFEVSKDESDLVFVLLSD